MANHCFNARKSLFLFVFSVLGTRKKCKHVEKINLEDIGCSQSVCVLLHTIYVLACVVLQIFIYLCVCVCIIQLLHGRGTL